MQISPFRSCSQIVFNRDETIASDVSLKHGEHQYAKANVTIPGDEALNKLDDKVLLGFIKQITESEDRFLRLSASSVIWAERFSELLMISQKQREITINILEYYRDSDVKLPVGADPTQFFLDKGNEFGEKLTKAMQANLGMTKRLAGREEFKLLTEYYRQLKYERLTPRKIQVGEEILFRLEEREAIYNPIKVMEQEIRKDKYELGTLALGGLKIIQGFFDPELVTDEMRSEVVRIVSRFPHDEKIEFSKLLRQYLIDEELIDGQTYPFFEKFAVDLLTASLEPDNVTAIETLGDFILSENGFKVTSQHAITSAVISLCALKNNPLVLQIMETTQQRKIFKTTNNAVGRYLESSNPVKKRDSEEVNRQKTVEEIRKLWNEGYLPLAGWIEEKRLGLYNFITRRTVFSSVSTALTAAKIPSAFWKGIPLKKPTGDYSKKDYVDQLIKQRHRQNISLELKDIDLKLLIAGIFHYGTWPNAVKENTGLDIKFPALEEVTPESIEKVARKAGIKNAISV